MTTPETHVKRHLTEAQRHLEAMRRERERIHQLAAGFAQDTGQAADTPAPDVNDLEVQL